MFSKHMDPYDVVLVVGKGGSGKSTIAKKICRGSKTRVYYSLDELIRTKIEPGSDLYVWHLYLVQEDNTFDKLKEQFITLVRDTISVEVANGKCVVLEGTLKDPKVIDAIFKEYRHSIVYVQPTKSRYLQNITARIKRDVLEDTSTLGFVWGKKWNISILQRASWKESGCISDDFNEMMEKINETEWKRLQTYMDSWSKYNLTIVINE